MTDLVTLLHGDCIEVMATLEADSVDAVVTDPPYGIGFMGKAWDAFDLDPVEASWSGKGRNHESKANPDAETPGGRHAERTGFRPTNPRCANCGRATLGRDTAKGFKVCHCENPVIKGTPNRDAQRFQQWCMLWGAEAFRVTKPGGYLLAFGGTRTHHRLVCALEDAGWIIRDELDWIYASGFPKGKANLKPAHEPIVLARKPGPLRPLGIDECRIDTNGETLQIGSGKPGANFDDDAYEWPGNKPEQHPAGRWPSNVLLSDPELFDQPNPYVVGSGATTGPGSFPETISESMFGIGGYSDPLGPRSTGDSGGYSRFFIIPKADRAERERGLAGRTKEMMVIQTVEDWAKESSVLGGGQKDRVRRGLPATEPRANVHPTVKPIDLMRHLVRLVTPQGGTVLDPFLGSGTTALAASEEGFSCIGIEREAEYLEIARGRLAATKIGMGL